MSGARCVCWVLKCSEMIAAMCQAANCIIEIGLPPKQQFLETCN